MISDSKKFLPFFMEHFHDKLLQPNGNNPVRDRAAGFKKIFELLDAQNRDDFFILETGTMRQDHGQFCFGDDGCSTYIFDKFISEVNAQCAFGKKGSFVSVDISSSNCDYSRSQTIQCEVVCEDSVSFIHKFPDSVKWDLIYLDSFDVQRDNPHPSAMHHLKELCAVMRNVRKTSEQYVINFTVDPKKAEIVIDSEGHLPKIHGTIICVDDADAFFDGGKTGKAMYVREFMDQIGATKIHDGYQLIYQL